MTTSTDYYTRLADERKEREAASQAAYAANRLPEAGMFRASVGDQHYSDRDLFDKAAGEWRSTPAHQPIPETNCVTAKPVKPRTISNSKTFSTSSPDWGLGVKVTTSKLTEEEREWLGMWVRTPVGDIGQVFCLDMMPKYLDVVIGPAEKGGSNRLRHFRSSELVKVASAAKAGTQPPLV